MTAEMNPLEVVRPHDRERACESDDEGECPGRSGGRALDVGRLCHDMRQPLAAILLVTGALQYEPELSERGRRFVQQIRDHADWLADLLSQASGGPQSVPSAEPMDVTAVVQRATSAVAPYFPGTLGVDAADDVGWLVGDPVLLRRAVANLLDNATRAAGDGGTVAVRVWRTGGEVVIDVEDDGPGLGAIPGGRGLGLTVVGVAMAAHGGTFRLMDAGMLGGVLARLALPAPSSR